MDDDTCSSLRIDYDDSTCAKLDTITQGRTNELNTDHGNAYFEKTCVRGNC